VLIQWIEIKDFRNYPHLALSPEPTLNILSGPNAQGKTNLLEALGVLLLGRSFRGARTAELPRWEASAASLSGAVARGDVTRSLRRSVTQREDGGWIVAGEGCPWARAIAFGWQDLGILNGGPQFRRGLLDGFAAKLQPAHLTAHARYRQILARRNHLLQQGGPAALTPWDEQLAVVGVEILVRRRAAVALLSAEVGRLYPEISGHDGRVRLEYRASFDGDMTVERFIEAIERRRTEELSRGLTLVGPHRDDLVIELDGRDMRLYGSRGQQRLLALALRLAETGPVEAAVGSPPVLLLDDALSELDPEVQARVLGHVALAGQVFLTSAEPMLPGAGAATWWEVRGGQVGEMVAVVRGVA
jgi:DNA replication and repair protein RecF